MSINEPMPMSGKLARRFENVKEMGLEEVWERMKVILAESRESVFGTRYGIVEVMMSDEGIVLVNEVEDDENHGRIKGEWSIEFDGENARILDNFERENESERSSVLPVMEVEPRKVLIELLVAMEKFWEKKVNQIAEEMRGEIEKVV